MKFSTRSSSRAGSQMPADHRLQRHDARLALVVDLLPLGEVLPAGGDDRPTFVSEPFERMMKRVGPEELRDRVAVVAQVVVVGVLQVAVRRLQLDEHQRHAVDEPDQVGAPAVHVASDPELRDEEEVVVLRIAPSR